VAALEAGNFYASTGVSLSEVKRSSEMLSLTIAAEPGVEYTTQFIGTRKSYDKTHKPYTVDSGAKLRVTHQYSDDIGTVLATVKGKRAVYHFKGDEIYVRAKITASNRMRNPRGYPEFQSAWMQPVRPRGR
jgi:hypothetical protein